MVIKFNDIKKLSSQMIIDAMAVIGWNQTMIKGSNSLFKGKKIFGEAVTLNFVPYRNDLLEDLPKGVNLRNMKPLNYVAQTKF